MHTSGRKSLKKIPEEKSHAFKFLDLEYRYDAMGKRNKLPGRVQTGKKEVSACESHGGKILNSLNEDEVEKTPEEYFSRGTV